MTPHDEPPDGGDNVVNIRPPGDTRPEVPHPTIVVNRRRYASDRCQHRGPYYVDKTLATVECGDCGAALNPLFVLEVLACHESYWNVRTRDLQRYLDQINKELDGRQRTKCVHCGNMTPIRFTADMPRTWVHQPEY